MTTVKPRWIVDVLLTIILAVTSWTLVQVIEMKVDLAKVSQRLEDHIDHTALSDSGQR